MNEKDEFDRPHEGPLNTTSPDSPQAGIPSRSAGSTWIQ